MSAETWEPLAVREIEPGFDTWHVASQSRDGVYHVVSRSPLGLWSCTCEWGRGALRLNAKPCAHLRRMNDYLADLARKAG